MHIVELVSNNYDLPNQQFGIWYTTMYFSISAIICHIVHMFTVVSDRSLSHGDSKGSLVYVTLLRRINYCHIFIENIEMP